MCLAVRIRTTGTATATKGHTSMMPPWKDPKSGEGPPHHAKVAHGTNQRNKTTCKRMSAIETAFCHPRKNAASWRRRSAQRKNNQKSGLTKELPQRETISKSKGRSHSPTADCSAKTFLVEQVPMSNSVTHDALYIRRVPPGHMGRLTAPSCHWLRRCARGAPKLRPPHPH